MEGVQDGYYAGLHSVDGILCHHLLFLDDDTEGNIQRNPDIAALSTGGYVIMWEDYGNG